MKISTSAELTAAIMDWGAKHQTAMNGLIAAAPADLKPGLEAQKTALGDILSALKLPEAKDVTADVFAALAAPFKRIMDYADGILAEAQKSAAAAGRQTLALQKFDTDIAAGDLLPKDKYTPLIDTAREQGKTEAMALVTATRKTLIALAGLPEADAGTLALGVAEFDTAVTGAKANLETLKKKGLVLGGKGDAWVKDLAWKTGTAFQGQMTKIEELVTGFKTPAGGTPDPLLGGAGGAGGPADEPQKMILA